MNKIEIRGETVVVDGYVNVTGRESRPIPDGKGGFFIEKFERGSFKKALEKANEVKILINHDKNKELGSTKTNLTLKEDVIGLRAHAIISDPEAVKKAKENKFRGWSFRFFKPKEQRAEMAGGMSVRIVSDMEIDEVSLIDEKMRPWYDSTTVEARAEGEEIIFELRSEEYDFEYEEQIETRHDHTKLKKIIEKFGGKTSEK